MRTLGLAVIVALLVGTSSSAQTSYAPASSQGTRMMVHGRGGPPAPDGSPILYDVVLDLPGGFVLKADQALKSSNPSELSLVGNVRLVVAK